MEDLFCVSLTFFFFLFFELTSETSGWNFIL